MGRVRASLVVAVVVSLLVGGPVARAFADVTNATATNVQDGSNRGNSHQGGASNSGDAVGGQVTGVVASGRTSVDARNVSKDSSVESGDASASNSSRSFVGQASAANDVSVGAADLSFITGATDNFNVQDGNNRQTTNQTANATTGDGVAGEVIGVVTGAGGSTSVVAANTTSNSDVTTGDADATNDSASFVGQAMTDDGGIFVADISNITAPDHLNAQDGNNSQTANQNATSSSGDGVAGQIVGVVSAGRTSVDANNTSDNVSAETGDADASNSSVSFVGQALSDFNEIQIGAADITNVDADESNIQDGNNRQTVSQSASSTTGDAVAGEVIGSVTSAGGSASIVAANKSTNSDVTTGDASSDNDSNAFVGQAMNEDDGIFVSDISNVTLGDESNIQDGNNSQNARQSATSTTGDGIAGQVIGAVSAGATSIDARNTSDNVSAETGDSDSSNDSSSFVGQAFADGDSVQIGAASDVSNITVDDEANIQDGTNRQSLSQSATSTTGDGVAGEVIGAVTSAGGGTSIVAANTSRNSDVTTGDSDSSNDSTAFVGIAESEDSDVSVISDIDNVSINAEGQVQDGNNRQTLSQSASSSTGDGVAGQVIGAVSAGATSIDANNTSDNVSVDTGDADSSNNSEAYVGLAYAAEDVQIGVATDVNDVTISGPGNAQDGNNSQSASQSASAATGDGVAGEVIGAVTSAGGSASIVAANKSTNSDAETGDATSSNDSQSFVGLANSVDEVEVAADVANVTFNSDGNVQDGSNRQSLSQTATANSGDGIVGQVVGVVSAGATSVDATNTTDDSSATSGDADASNSTSNFVGLADGQTESIDIGPADVSNVDGAANIQDGSNRQSLSQSAAATSGDAVSGQVLAGVTAGVITGAGGSASVVVANTSQRIDSTSGDATFDNTSAAFVGQAFTTGPVTVSGGPLT